jgi:hypothetical protein
LNGRQTIVHKWHYNKHDLIFLLQQFRFKLHDDRTPYGAKCSTVHTHAAASQELMYRFFANFLALLEATERTFMTRSQVFATNTSSAISITCAVHKPRVVSAKHAANPQKASLLLIDLENAEPTN